MVKVLLACSLSVLLFACGSSNQEAKQTESGQLPVSASALQAHIEFLAHDLLEGRETGTQGYDIAAEYVVSHFKQYGLLPKGDQLEQGASYLQSINFRRAHIDKSSVKMSLFKNGKATQLNYPQEFVTGASSMTTSVEFSGELVFVGFGVEAPEFNHNDYADINVKDKIVVMLSQTPLNLPSEEAAHFASRQQRVKTAAKHGAIGVIYLQTPQSEKRYSYQRMLGSLGKPSFEWLTPEGIPGNHIESIKGGALLSIETAKQLFEGLPHSYEQLITMADNKEQLPRFDLNQSMTLSKESSHQTVKSANVVGLIEGTDPLLKHEVVMYTAHLDHIGLENHHDQHQTPTSDQVNNGALDNATGTAILLETARLFAANPSRRSVLFVVVTGEEKGLLGSDYFAHYPSIEINNIIANINLDMPLILYPIGDIIAFGAEHSSLNQYVQRATEKAGLQVSPDPMPEQNIFVRSDHYSMVKKGVPAIFLMPGFKSLDPEINGAEIFKTFIAKHYHQPSDSVDLAINYEAGVTFTEVNYMIGTEVANSDTRPQWNEGDFFGKTFGIKP